MNDTLYLQTGDYLIYTGPLPAYYERIGVVESISEVTLYGKHYLISLRIKSDINSAAQSINAYEDQVRHILLNDLVLRKIGFEFDETGYYHFQSMTVVKIPGYLTCNNKGGLVAVSSKYKISEGDLTISEPGGGSEYVGYLSNIQNYSRNMYGEDLFSNSVEALIGAERKSLDE